MSSIIFAPILEEYTKRFMSRFTGGSAVMAGLLFGLFELIVLVLDSFLSGNLTLFYVVVRVACIFMHPLFSYVGRNNILYGILFHSLWNGYTTIDGLQGFQIISMTMISIGAMLVSENSEENYKTTQWYDSAAAVALVVLTFYIHFIKHL